MATKHQNLELWQGSAKHFSFLCDEEVTDAMWRLVLSPYTNDHVLEKQYDQISGKEILFLLTEDDTKNIEAGNYYQEVWAEKDTKWYIAATGDVVVNSTSKGVA